LEIQAQRRLLLLLLLLLLQLPRSPVSPFNYWPNLARVSDPASDNARRS